MKDFSAPKSRRSETMVHGSTMRGGKLMPVAIAPFRLNESGVLSQTIGIELEPIAGRLVSDIIAEVNVVYVPALAVDKMLNEAIDENAGNAEIYRKRLLAEEELIPYEVENVFAERMGVNPKPINGQKMVLSACRVAHNAAVNFLRLERYFDASLVDVNNMSITPAILGTTALQRLNGVLTPEDRVNGAVHLDGEIPIRGIGLQASKVGTVPGPLTSRDSAGQTNPGGEKWVIDDTADAGTNSKARLVIEQDPDNAGFPNIRADFALGTGQTLSRKDFFQAERMDEMARLFNAMVMSNPQQGEEMITRMVHGLQVETGVTPFSLYKKTVALGAGIKSAMDGPNLDVKQTVTSANVSFSTVVPKSEFGGFVITFLSVKPEETFSKMPHPILTSPWGLHNHAADELAIDPVPVYARDLDLDTAQEDENQIMMYVGNNHLPRNYQRIDYSRDVDKSTIEHKSAEWRYTIPLSVTPENVIYPADIDHYPFADQLGDAVHYTVMSQADIASPYKLGPTPLEDIAILDTAVFDEIPE